MNKIWELFPFFVWVHQLIACNGKDCVFPTLLWDSKFLPLHEKQPHICFFMHHNPLGKNKSGYAGPTSKTMEISTGLEKPDWFIFDNNFETWLPAEQLQFYKPAFTILWFTFYYSRKCNCLYNCIKRNVIIKVIACDSGAAMWHLEGTD